MPRQTFNYENSRVDYGELLQPEVGYQLDFAVGLTYSLDLEALLGVPVSLGMLDDMDSSNMQNPFFLLEAIRKSSDKIAIFCNAGCIKMPQRIEPVFALLENSVFEINLPKKANFHPKLWIIKYSNEDGLSYIKVITLSRNLTFDRSFDVAVEMQGAIGAFPNEKHRPLADMLQFAAKYSAKDKAKKIRSLSEDLLKVTKFELDEQFEDYAFHPFGITGYKNAAAPLFADAYQLLVISPFLSDAVVNMITAKPKYKTLITRKASVSPKVLKCFDEVYITKDIVMNDELLEESGNPSESQRDVHAKVYFKNNYYGNYLYLGSLNASANAFYNNVEFMLELKFKPYCGSYQLMLKDFLPDEGNPFEQLRSTDDYCSESGDEGLDDISDIINALGTAAVVQQQGRFAVTVECGSLCTPAEIAPLFRSHAFVSLGTSTVLPDLLLKELSELYVIRRGALYAVVKIHTDGLPYADRDNAIYNSIISSKSRFLAFVAFLLADNYSEASLEQRSFMESLRLGSENTGSIPAGLYERMLRTAAIDPRRLDDIENVMSKLDPEIVTDDFRQIVKVFREAAKKEKRR
jgi:hypothetical protein